MSESIKVIEIIKTPNITYVNKNKSGVWPLLFNYKKLEQSWSSDWAYVEGEIESVSKIIPGKIINRHYELIDKDMESAKIPLMLPYDGIKDEDGYWKKEYAHLESLYKFNYDKTEDTFEDIEFELKCLAELTEEPSPIKKYKIDYCLADKIFFPSIVLPLRPVILSSVEFYKIIRQYVLDNIDNSVAKVTSNHDFCFTVKKLIRLHTPEEYTVDINNSFFNKRKRKPKYEKRVKKYREETIFEMTHAGDRYKGYTVLPPVEAVNEEELDKIVTKYLNDLMGYINTPYCECDKCKGAGYLKTDLVKPVVGN